MREMNKKLQCDLLPTHFTKASFITKGKSIPEMAIKTKAFLMRKTTYLTTNLQHHSFTH